MFKMAKDSAKRIADHVDEHLAVQYLGDRTVEFRSGESKTGAHARIIGVDVTDGSYKLLGEFTVLQEVLGEQIREVGEGGWTGGRLVGPGENRRYYRLAPTDDAAPFEVAVSAFQADNDDVGF